MACTLLEVNAEMARILKTIAPAVAAAAIGAFVAGGVAEARAQQVDLSTTVFALPVGSTSPAAQTTPQQELNLSAGACGPNGLHEQTKVTFEDEHHNAWYRATAKGLNLTGEKGLRVIGALLPRWNLAAQMGASGGTAPGNTANAMAWSMPNPQLGATPWNTPRIRLVWVPTLTVQCPTP